MARIPRRRRKPELTTRPSRDLSQQAGNPTFEIQKNYDELMSITDVDELVRRAVEIIEPTMGTGFSEKNYEKTTDNNRSCSGSCHDDDGKPCDRPKEVYRRGLSDGYEILPVWHHGGKRTAYANTG